MRHVREVAGLLEAGKMFCETEKIALKIQTMGRNITEEDLQKFRSMLSRWDSEEVKKHLEENERRNIEFWKTLLTR